jgi:hypothetical protein
MSMGGMKDAGDLERSQSKANVWIRWREEQRCWREQREIWTRDPGHYCKGSQLAQVHLGPTASDTTTCGQAATADRPLPAARARRETSP